MSTFWTPNTLPDKKKILQCLLRLLFAPCLWFLAKGYYFLVPQNFAPCLQNYKQFNNILSPSSQEMEKKKPKKQTKPLLQTCLLQLGLGRQWSALLALPPQQFPHHWRILQIKIQMVPENYKIWEGEWWLQSLPVVGAAPFWGTTLGRSILPWNREVRFFLSLWPRWGLQHQDIHTNMN